MPQQWLVCVAECRVCLADYPSMTVIAPPRYLLASRGGHGPVNPHQPAINPLEEVVLA